MNTRDQIAIEREIIFKQKPWTRDSTELKDIMKNIVNGSDDTQHCTI
jgi:hypothetical protein